MGSEHEDLEFRRRGGTMAENKPTVGETSGEELRTEPSAVRETSSLTKFKASRPPQTRRDPRADPDDEPVSARVDVVTMDRTGERSSPSVDALTNAALTLRRELAKLHQQAAAVERTIEDQRRERSEAIERVELATSRADELEHKLQLTENELANVRRLHDAALEDLQGVRSERDDLARAIDNAKSATEDLLRLRAEVETLREAHDSAFRTASTLESELLEIRKREQAEAQKVSDGEAELRTMQERIERLTAELTQSQNEAAQNKTDLVRLRQEATTQAETAAKKHGDLERNHQTAKDEIARLEKALAEARSTEEKLATVTADLSTARVEGAKARTEVTRLERDVEAARHARDVSLERATMAERESADARKDIDRLQREVEALTMASANASSRAAGAERARVAVEDSVRQLRDELASAFARWRSITPSTPPPPGENAATAPPTRAVLPSHDLSARNLSDAPPVTRRGAGSTSFPPLLADVSSISMPVPSPLPTPPLDDDWPLEPQPPPAPKAPGARPAPVPTAMPPAPVLEATPVVAGRSKASIPPAVYPSLPPPAGSTPTATPPPAVFTQSEAPSGLHILSEERDDLIERLGDPATAHEAASKLLDRPDWLRSRPPVELLIALTHLDYDVEAPVFELARAWEREPICRALIAALRDEPDPKLREHGAWLLKHLGAPGGWPAIAELVSDEAEPPAVRRWLLEAVERLVASRALTWHEVGDLVGRLVHHPDASLRDGAIGVVAALERSDEKRRVLLEILRTDDDEMVLASAVHALGSALPIELDPAVSERLLGHPSARVQRSVVEFVERSKRASK
jgi:hypothetical protein